MAIMRRRVRFAGAIGSLVSCADVGAFVWGLIAGGAVAAEHVAARNLRERDDLAAVGGGKGVGSGAIAERHGLGGAQSSLLAALDDEECLLGIDPVGRSRLLPAGRARHVGHVDRADITGLIRHQGEGYGVAHRGEPVLRALAAW